MAANGSAGFVPVMEALSAMQSSLDRSKKSQAHEYLEKFQKSSEAWAVTNAMLSSSEVTPEAKLFAATTLKGKITYDLDQIPKASLSGLRGSLLRLLSIYKTGPRPVRTQLCVCLANLALQMLEWKDVIQTVGSSLGDTAGDCILDFLRVLPEEVTEGRRINLSEDELSGRTSELLGDNAQNVLALLVQYSQSSADAASNPMLLECIASWLREIPAADIVNSPLFNCVIESFGKETSFDAAVECMCTILKDTREVDESIEIIQIIYPRLLSLTPQLAKAAEAEDMETFKGLTRVFTEAGEHWVIMIARLPTEFQGLVQLILECCARDPDEESISLTFLFWYEFKQMVTLEKYKAARDHFMPVFSRLVDIMIRHLQFPMSEGQDSADLFEGDREKEERFREFRHQMGDVLKDCCDVITPDECLSKAFNLIREWISKWASHANGATVPHWQELEAPLFSMRAMGRNVSPEENVILKQAIPLIVQIPNHEKLRFQAIMALARYTEWTAQHPEFLQPQLNFVIAGFEHPSMEVIKAAALAFRFFGADCKTLLKDHATQLQPFYDSVLDKLEPPSQEEVTTGVACIISAQPIENIYPMFKLYCDPITRRIMSRANECKDQTDDKVKHTVADGVLLLTTFVQYIQPYVEPGQENPAVKYCQEINPILSAVVENFITFVPIVEAVCRCWRYMVLSYRTAILPLLPTLAQQLASGFENSRQGCFLWTTDAVLREFALGAEFVDATTSQAIYQFFEQQAVAFLRLLNNNPPTEMPDVIEDFFRLLLDALIYYHKNFLSAAICDPILSASITCLTLQQYEPLTAILHFLRDFLSYGTDNPNSSSFDTHYAFSSEQNGSITNRNPPEIQNAVKQLIVSHGETLVQRTLTGMMFHFPRDCFADSSGVLLAMLKLIPQQTAGWIKGTLELLPLGTCKPQDAEKLIQGLGKHIQAGEVSKMRYLLQDFANGYRRRHVAPREGVGRLEARRFRFSG